MDISSRMINAGGHFILCISFIGLHLLSKRDINLISILSSALSREYTTKQQIFIVSSRSHFRIDLISNNLLNRLSHVSKHEVFLYLLNILIVTTCRHQTNQDLAFECLERFFCVVLKYFDHKAVSSLFFLLFP